MTLAKESFISLPFRLERAPPPFEKNDIKYPESLVRHFLRRYTREGDKVFDPFCGLGTTLFVAEEMKRKAYGMEADVNRHAWVAGQLEGWMNLACADAARMAQMSFPKMDFCMMSPPFMPVHHQWNPLYAGNPAHAGYGRYLKRMRHILSQLPKVMKRGARVVIQVDNIPGARFTPLVRDIGAAASHSLRQEGEVIVAWEKPAGEYKNTHCLVFKTF